MKRLLYDKLLDWKKDKSRKPLLLQGARQVGKTYLINQFAKNEYQNSVYLNFEGEPGLATLFSGKLDPESIIINIGLYLGRKLSHENTLFFFDEIQACPEAITSLNYFKELVPEYHVVAAGSLIGVSVGKDRSFPVGKVNFLRLYPMSFVEYLFAFGEDVLVEAIMNIREIVPFQEIIHDKLLRHLKMYLFLGGMPEVLQNYLDNKDVQAVRKIQNEILESYSRDFSKYADKIQAVKTSEVWNSIPYQLAKENKKFKFSDVRKNARASLYASTIEWLKMAGLINPAYNVSVPKLPLGGYSDLSKFKIYTLDTGLLGAALKVTSDIIINGNDLFSEYNGAFIENFVANELKILFGDELYYWKSNSDAEVDFIIQSENEIFPLEVKSGLSRNIKSLRSYQQKFNPKYILRTSPRNFVRDNEFVNIPLYAMFAMNNIFNLINR